MSRRVSVLPQAEIEPDTQRGNTYMDETILKQRSPIPLPFSYVLQHYFGGSKVTARTLRFARNSGELPFFYIGGKAFTFESDVLKWKRKYLSSDGKQLGWIYAVGFLEYIKIGFATDVDRRISQLQGASPLPLDEYLRVRGSRIDEACLHKRFKSHKLNGEWYSFSTDIIQWLGENGCYR